MWVQSLGQGDPPEKEKATHSSILVWKIPWTEEPGEPQSIMSQRVGHDWQELDKLTHTVTWEKNESLPLMVLAKIAMSKVMAWANSLINYKSWLSEEWIR